jgi:hypothetical protein
MWLGPWFCLWVFWGIKDVKVFMWFISHISVVFSLSLSLIFHLFLWWLGFQVKRMRVFLYFFFSFSFTLFSFFHHNNDKGFFGKEDEVKTFLCCGSPFLSLYSVLFIDIYIGIFLFFIPYSKFIIRISLLCVCVCVCHSFLLFCTLASCPFCSLF